MRLTSGRSRVNGQYRQTPAPVSKIALTHKFKLASENDLILIPGMRFSAMATGYSAGFELGGGKGIFFDHHPRYIEFFCYRTSHQDSLDHGANISQLRLKARAILPSRGSGILCNKKPTTLNKQQQPFERGPSDVSRMSAASPYEHVSDVAFHWILYDKAAVIQTLKIKRVSCFQTN